MEVVRRVVVLVVIVEEEEEEEEEEEDLVEVMEALVAMESVFPGPPNRSLKKLLKGSPPCRSQSAVARGMMVGCTAMVVIVDAA